MQKRYLRKCSPNKLKKTELRLQCIDSDWRNGLVKIFSFTEATLVYLDHVELTQLLPYSCKAMQKLAVLFESRALWATEIMLNFCFPALKYKPLHKIKLFFLWTCHLFATWVHAMLHFIIQLSTSSFKNPGGTNHSWKTLPRKQEIAEVHSGPCRTFTKHQVKLHHMLQFSSWESGVAYRNRWGLMRWHKADLFLYIEENSTSFTRLQWTKSAAYKSNLLIFRNKKLH